MTRQRLRPAHTPGVLATMVYDKPYDHTHHPDHVFRVAATIQLARWLTTRHILRSAADLGCGDGAILDGLSDLIPAAARWYGDLTPGPPGRRLDGPIEDTALTCPSVDLMVLTETLEHLDDPDLILGLLRDRGRRLVLSTPVDAWNDQNIEHYWAWGRTDVEAMLAGAGWSVTFFAELDFRPAGSEYAFGIWAAR